MTKKKIQPKRNKGVLRRERKATAAGLPVEVASGLLLQPVNCLLSYRKADEMLTRKTKGIIKIDKYAVVPLEHYQGLLRTVQATEEYLRRMREQVAVQKKEVQP